MKLESYPLVLKRPLAVQIWRNASWIEDFCDELDGSAFELQNCNEIGDLSYWMGKYLIKLEL